MIDSLPGGPHGVLLVDKCSGHMSTTELKDVAKHVNTEIRYFPFNSTHLIQPCDSFVIKKIKRACTKSWKR